MVRRLAPWMFLGRGDGVGGGSHAASVVASPTQRGVQPIKAELDFADGSEKLGRDGASDAARTALRYYAQQKS